MTPAELTVTAALGASLLTGLASLGVVWFQESHRNKAADEDALAAAIGEILSRSLSVAFRARALGEMMKQRSGLMEGWDIALRHRKPVEMPELHDWIAQDLAPLNAALSQIWTRCDQEGVRLANDVVGKCGDLLGVSTAVQPVRSWPARIRNYVVGERWTPEMLADYERALKDLAQARKQFAEYARSKLGRGPADLFAQVESQQGGTPKAVTSG